MLSRNDNAAVDIRIIAATIGAIIALWLGWSAFRAIETWMTDAPMRAGAVLLLLSGVLIMIAGPRRVGRHAPVIGVVMVLVAVALFVTA